LWVAVFVFVFVGVSNCLEPLTASVETVNVATERAAAKVVVRLQNLNDGPLYFLKWNTPFESFPMGDIFIVNIRTISSLESKSITERMIHTGAVAFRGEPTAEDYLSFNANEERSVDIDLSKYYDMSQPGEYSVQLSFYLYDYTNTLTTINTNFSNISPKIESNIQFINQDFVRPLENNTFVDNRGEVEPNGFINCNQQLVNLLTGSWNGYRGMIATALGMINPGMGPAFYRWFGHQNVYNRVRYVFNQISAAQGWSVNFYCNAPQCGGNIWAYVYPTDRTLTIHFCNPYYRATLPQQSGVMIHELSHFNAVSNPGCQDIAYGPQACQNFAKSNPNAAANNADCYNCFAQFR